MLRSGYQPPVAKPVPGAAPFVNAGHVTFAKYVPALLPVDTSAIAKTVPDFEVSVRHTDKLSGLVDTASLPPQSSDDSTPFRPAVVVSVEYVWESVYTVFSAVRPLRRSDCAARS